MNRIRTTAAWVLLIAAWHATSFAPDGHGRGSQALARAFAAVSSREERLGAARASAALWLIVPSVIWKREAAALRGLADAAHERVVEPLGAAAGRAAGGSL